MVKLSGGLEFKFSDMNKSEIDLFSETLNQMHMKIDKCAINHMLEKETEQNKDILVTKLKTGWSNPTFAIYPSVGNLFYMIEGFKGEGFDKGVRFSYAPKNSCDCFENSYLLLIDHSKAFYFLTEPMIPKNRN